MEQLQAITEQIKRANHIVILTGAGVSTASGIPDFRSTDGIWEQDRSREYYMSADYFFKDPVDFWNKYKQIFRIKLMGQYGPNDVHTFLKQLENNNKEISIITQNVDGLHAQAGNKHVVEYHGSLRTATCPSCGANYDLNYILQSETPTCVKSFGNHSCGDILKPDIVLFGDAITEHDKAEAIIDQADFLLVLGTSLFVMPFNFLPEYASMQNVPTALINGEPTLKDRLFDYVIHDDLSKVVEQMKAQL
ncbi:NAD-dependent protein deacylase [Pontibacillus litoralis]|uniref:protein acetyllysine N-acetyltransferase n=1 Tax=Pontibacillus litoralis JSM 072002 TaxID=1385512 RepID=A0A0A5G1F5_9BACI|nr:NAD-dependent protein deacylase [Pontibacillus litoralis]KGX86931.1 NAD-dependent deacetylase [Pontibacillus litoralis JSM 072002]